MNDSVGFQSASRVGGDRHQLSAECPERSEEYRELQRRAMSNVRTESEYHNVSTDQKVVVIDGEVRFRITAMCACGWSDTKTIPDGDD